jgi:hypothetical protein
MFRRLSIMIVVALLAALVVGSPVAAGGGSTQRIEDFGSVLAVRFDADFPLGSLMRLDCDWLVRVEHRDGSAIETMRCTLSDDPVMIPEFQGSPPDSAFLHGGGACLWTSEYWWSVIGAPVYAASFSYVVTPSGEVRATSTYPADPLTCE